MQPSKEEVIKAVEIARNSFKQNKWPENIPERHLKEMKRVSEKYRSIRWLPLDIPKFEFENYEKFLEVWDRECIPVVRIKPDVAEPYSKEEHPGGTNSDWYKPSFKGLYIHMAGNPEKFTTGIWAHKYYPDPVFEPLVNHVKKYFPFYSIHHMYIWESIIPIGMHLDQTKFWDAPTEFRLMINDDNPQPTLFVADMEHLDINYIDLPPDTNSFCWSNGTQMHGSDFFGKRKQLLVVNGILSISKLEALIERSIEKYKTQLNYKLEI
jgi:hypothetical protein